MANGVTDVVEDETQPEDTDEAIEPVEPEEVEEPETADAGGPWSRMPGWVTGVIALASVGGFALVIWKGWEFIVSKDEVAEKADWEQLLGLIDRVDTLVLFILGAVFGVAVQARQTADAKVASDKNQNEARKQHQKAKKVRDQARRNRRAAVQKGELAREGLSRVKHVLDVVENVGRDPKIAFVTGTPAKDDPHVARSIMTMMASAQPPAAAGLEVRDREPALDELASELRAFVAKAEKRLR
jgi:hypothetical protein